MKWYAKNSGSGQGLISDEDTGASIAVSYDEKHGPLIAAAPDLLASLKETLDALYNETHGHDDSEWIQSVKRNASFAISQAEEPCDK